jgi:hypothetical protein
MLKVSGSRGKNPNVESRPGKNVDILSTYRDEIIHDFKSREPKAVFYTAEIKKQK